jgi:hypothetical protein
VSIIEEGLTAHSTGIFYDVIVFSFLTVGVPPGAFAFLGAEHSRASFGFFGDDLAAVFAEVRVVNKNLGV